MDAASFGSSTMHSTVRSRLSSRQIRQRSPSATLPHSRQNTIRRLACTIESARRSASSAGALISQNARRCADFGPMPGSRESSSISAWMGPSYTSGLLVSHGLRPEHLLDPAERFGIVSGGIVFLDRLDVRAVVRRARLAHDARDLRRDAEQFLEHLLERGLAALDLFDRVLEGRRERDLERRAVVGRRRGALHQSAEDRLLALTELLGDRAPRPPEHRDDDARRG